MPVQWTLILPPLGGEPTRQIELSDTMKVGRAGRSDVVIRDHSTSSSHATLEVRDDRLFVRDHGSTNGTMIDGGSRLPMGEWTAVPDGATLRFGIINSRIVGKVLGEAASQETREPRAAGSSPSADAAKGQGSFAAATAAYALEQIDARLLLLDETNPRAMRITNKVHSVGRSMSASCRIDSKRVSSEHALLSYAPETRTFEIEDLGSSNQTVLNGSPLAPHVAERLELDSALKFGPVEAVFRVDHDADGVRLAPNFDLKVAEALIASGKLKDEELSSALAAAKETGGFLGDVLILSGAVAPSDWAGAARASREAGPAVPYRGEAPSRGARKSLAVALVLLLAAVAARALS